MFAFYLFIYWQCFDWVILWFSLTEDIFEEAWWLEKCEKKKEREIKAIKIHWILKNAILKSYRKTDSN